MNDHTTRLYTKIPAMYVTSSVNQSSYHAVNQLTLFDEMVKTTHIAIRCEIGLIKHKTNLPIKQQ